MPCHTCLLSNFLRSFSASSLSFCSNRPFLEWNASPSYAVLYCTINLSLITLAAYPLYRFVGILVRSRRAVYSAGLRTVFDWVSPSFDTVPCFDPISHLLFLFPAALAIPIHTILLQLCSFTRLPPSHYTTRCWTVHHEIAWLSTIYGAGDSLARAACCDDQCPPTHSCILSCIQPQYSTAQRFPCHPKDSITVLSTLLHCPCTVCTVQYSTGKFHALRPFSKYVLYTDC